MYVDEIKKVVDSLFPCAVKHQRPASYSRYKSFHWISGLERRMAFYVLQHSYIGMLCILCLVNRRIVFPTEERRLFGEFNAPVLASQIDPTPTSHQLILPSTTSTCISLSWPTFPFYLLFANFRTRCCSTSLACFRKHVRHLQSSI